MRELMRDLLEAEVDELLGRHKSVRRNAVESAPGDRSGDGKPRRRKVKCQQRYRRHGLEAAATVRDWDWARMLPFAQFSSAHWAHLGTSDPIESPVAALRLRLDAVDRVRKAEHRVLRHAKDDRLAGSQVPLAHAPAGHDRRTAGGLLGPPAERPQGRPGLGPQGAVPAVLGVHVPRGRADLLCPLVLAIRAKDIDSCVALFAEDGVSHDPVGMPPHYGRDGARKFLESVFSLNASFRLTETGILTAAKL